MRAPQRQQTTARTVPAPRGEILDATHRVLAQSREMVRLEIAPREVTEPRQAAPRARPSLHVDRALIARALDTSVESTSRFPAAFSPSTPRPSTSLRGVHSYRDDHARSYAASPGAQGILGHVDGDNKPVDGLELSLDSILRGTPGTATIIQGFERAEPRVADRARAPRRPRATASC